MRTCDHEEHAQFGLGHISGPPLESEYALNVAALPAEFIAGDSAPVLDQGTTPQCEGYTAATGRRLTQAPLGQDGFDPSDLFRLAGGGAHGTTTQAMEQALLSPGALCTSGPDSGQRKPVASCQNISNLGGVHTAVYNLGFAGLAVEWDESWFTPKSDGTLPPPSGVIAGGHIFRVKGFSTARRAEWCQNSWSAKWGKGGFFWLPWAYLPAVVEAYTQIAIPSAPLEVTVPSTAELITTMPPRAYDSRLAGGPLAPGESRFVDLSGHVPANATGVIGNLTVTQEQANGWVSVTPTSPTAPFSTINFPAHDDRANGFSCALVSGGVVVHNGSAQPTHFLIDLTGYYIPA